MTLANANPAVPEDEPMVRDVIETYLTEDQHEVTTAVNGREGLEKFRRLDPISALARRPRLPD